MTSSDGSAGRPSLWTSAALRRRSCIHVRSRVILLATLLLAATSSLHSDAIVITRAMLASTIAEIFIEKDSVFVSLEIGASDIPAFRNAMPNEVYVALGLDAEPWTDRLDRFFTEDCVITDGNAPSQFKPAPLNLEPHLDTVGER